MSTLGNFSPVRATAVVAVAVAVGTTSTIALVHELAPGRSGAATARDFGGLLHLVALGSLAVSGVWVATMVGVLMWEQRQGASSHRRLGRLCPRAFRPGLIALCSAGTALGVAGPGAATPAAPAPPAAALPSLDRPLGGPARHHPHHDVIVVRSGDSLWSLVRTRHPAGSTTTTARRVRALYRANTDVIGPDPDLIRPGQVLRVPDQNGESR